MRDRSENERKAHLLETINAFGSILMRASSVHESAWSVAKHAVAKLGYIDCIIYLINDEGELYQCAAHGSKNPTAQDIKNPIKLKIGEGICGHVALTGKGEIIADTSKDPRYLADHEDRYSEIAVPVISDGIVVGIIDSEHSEKDYFSDHDLNILTTIASMLSLKISQTKALKEKDEWADELAIANKELAFQNEEKEKRADELAIANKELAFQNEEKQKRADELAITNTELAFQNEEKEKRADELAIANTELVFQGEENDDLIDELTIVKKEKLSRVEALALAKEKIVFQDEEKADLIDELVIANKELAFQNEEKAKRANELEFKIKHRTQELEESLEREKELGILKTNFVSMASHEFRTPLTSIKATSDVILKYFDKLSRNDIDERLEKIKNEVIEMTIMLEDILIIGKSESQKLDYNPTRVDIVRLIKDIVTEYQLSESENRQIVYGISSPIIEVDADKKWIKHIVLNLFSNAIKYSDKGKQIEINIKKEQAGISFSFKDYGIGISKKDVKQLFEPFHRGENAQNISGTGLGLSVLKKAVDLHKGKIEVESEIGRGSSFKVILPLNKNNHNEKI
ncbi:GAF domain-containing sensor histidine kinase [Winogradskyella sp. UBA3174]|uniref:GAF domain-containing sensor histidine kinase n=1 Tax=Winogradskyella sp. UBA3174 TaxID=1947785 RepID=UPI0025DF2107|nr:GAF domain-containing sensor histidine kinase [Winogradskyella sp. UBA3174]